MFCSDRDNREQSKIDWFVLQSGLQAVYNFIIVDDMNIIISDIFFIKYFVPIFNNILTINNNHY